MPVKIDSFATRMHPEITPKARLLLDLKPEEIVVVGDTVLDVACARSIGARCLAVCTGGSTQEELAAAKPDWLALNLSKIQAHTILC